MRKNYQAPFVNVKEINTSSLLSAASVCENRTQEEKADSVANLLSATRTGKDNQKSFWYDDEER